MSAVSDDVQISVPLPLDVDGFLRRECPTCERELKWRPTPEGEEPIPMPDGGYFCPYCGVQASPDAWLTEAQAAQVQQILQAVCRRPDAREIRRRPSTDRTRLTWDVFGQHTPRADRGAETAQ